MSKPATPNPPGPRNGPRAAAAPRGVDYMLAADGELGDDERATFGAAFSASDADATAAGVTELGALVRGHLELSADEAEPRLADLWDLVERRLDRDVEAVEAPAAAAAPTPSWFARALAWMSGHRSHLATGLVSAGAVAALALALRPEPPAPTERVVVKTVQVPAIAPTVLTASPPEVESLELDGATGTVFTVAGEGDEGETAVIWIEPDEPEDATEGI